MARIATVMHKEHTGLIHGTSVPCPGTFDPRSAVVPRIISRIVQGLSVGRHSAVPTRSKELGLMKLRGLVVSVVAAGCVVGSETTLTRHSPSASLTC